MASVEIKDGALSASAPQTAAPPSPPHSSGRETLSKPSMDAYDSNNNTPPFSPASDTPVLQKEQEEFEGTVNVNNDLPTDEDMKKVEHLLLLDAESKSRPFKDLYDASGVAPRQLIIFIRHFFCGVNISLSPQPTTHPLTSPPELPGIPPHARLLHNS